MKKQEETKISLEDLAQIKAVQYKKITRKLLSVQQLLDMDSNTIHNAMRTTNSVLSQLNKHDKLTVQSGDEMYNMFLMLELSPDGTKTHSHRFDIALFNHFSTLVYKAYRALIKSDRTANIEAVREAYVTSLDYNASYTKVDLVKRLELAYRSLKIDELARDIDLPDFFELERYKNTQFYTITSVVGAVENIPEPIPEKPKRFSFL